MKRPDWKRLARRLLLPGPAAVLLCAAAAAAGLAYVFPAAGETSPAAYPIYAFSAYALVILCAGAVPLGRRLAARVRRLPLARRLLEDRPFRAEAALHASLAVNLLYTAINAAAGLRARSAWFATLAVYYLFLAAMRFSLARYARRAPLGANWPEECRRARLCGVLLVLMNAALAGVVVLVLHRGGSFSYGGSMIYAAAAYTFYITIMGAVNLVRQRRCGSPVLYAARAVSLAAALVSMLSLEVAMLAAFATARQARFSAWMVGGSGFAVCAAVAGLGVHLLLRAARPAPGTPFSGGGMDDGFGSSGKA